MEWQNSDDISLLKQPSGVHLPPPSLHLVLCWFHHHQCRIDGPFLHPRVAPALLQKHRAVFGQQVEEGVGPVAVVRQLLSELGHIGAILHLLHEGAEVFG